MPGTPTTPSRGAADMALAGLFIASFAVIITGVLLSFFVAPTEAQMGIVQKIFYFHVPSAFASYVGFVLCGVGSVAYLLRPSRWSDRLGWAGAEVGVLFAVVVLITGPLWASKAWGTLWEWEPRLTSMLLTFLIYCSYLLLRAFGGAGEVARKIGAVMGVLGLVGIGVVRVAVKLWGGTHPQVVTGDGGGLHPDMWPAFITCVVGFLTLAVALVWARMTLAERDEAIESLHLLASDLEYDLEA